MAHVDTPTRTEHVAKRRRISGKVKGNTARESIYMWWGKSKRKTPERVMEEDGSEGSK